MKQFMIIALLGATALNLQTAYLWHGGLGVLFVLGATCCGYTIRDWITK